MFPNDYRVEHEPGRNDYRGEWVVREYRRSGSGSYWGTGHVAQTQAEAEKWMQDMVQWHEDQRNAEHEAYLCGYFMGRVSEKIARMRIRSVGLDFDEEYARRLPEYEAWRMSSE